MARKHRQHSSPAGWFRCLFRQPPANFYGRTSVYLSGSILEIEHSQRVTLRGEILRTEFSRDATSR